MIIVVDLDGTLCDDSHRAEFASQGEWDAYHALCIEDRPHRDVDLFIRIASIYRNIQIIAMTGRPEKWRPITNQWLISHGFEIDHLLMRPDDDYRKAGEVKWELLVAHCGGEDAMKEQVIMMLEDNETQFDFWRGKGMPCWLVR